MDLQFYGANCLTISTKQSRLVIDDDLVKHGGKSVSHSGDICIFTSPHPEPVKEAKMTIDIPGEYEVNGISIHGMPARAHMDEENDRTGVMYKIVANDIKLLVTGHIFPTLTDAKLEDIGMVDVLILPVGGHGYTLDPVGALHIIKQIEPKVIIPTHYADGQLSFEVPQLKLDEVLKELSMEPAQTVRKFQLKAGAVTDVMQLVILEKP